VILLTVLSAALGSPPAPADEGDAAVEGYELVQQALSFLVDDSGPEGVAQAVMKVDDVLAAVDHEGVAVEQVQEARAALLAGDRARARALLQASIAVAVSELRPAVGEETGTSIVFGPLPTIRAFIGWDWAFLGLSLLMILGGIVLAVRFRGHITVGAT